MTKQSATVLLKTQSLSGWWSIEGAVAQGMVIHSALQANFPLKQNIFKASLLRPEFIVKRWSEMSVRLVFLEGNYNKNYLSPFYRGRFFMEKCLLLSQAKNLEEDGDNSAVFHMTLYPLSCWLNLLQRTWLCPML